MTTNSDQPPRAGVPADIGAADKIAFGLTFRQLAILGGVGFAGFGLYRTYADVLPPLVWLILGLPVTAVAVVIALGHRDGLPLDVWLKHGVVLTRTPRTLAPGQPRATSVAAVAAKPVLPAPLRSPISGISAAGVLSSEGVNRVLIACGTTNIHLRTGEEQAGLLDGFGRFLNSLTGPAQLVISAHRHDLAPYAQAIAENAPRLSHPALQQAADDYAAFLLELDASRDPLRRQVLTVVTGEQAAEAATRALSGLGVEAVALDGPCVAAALAAAVDPFTLPAPGPRAVPGTPITLRRT